MKSDLVKQIQETISDGRLQLYRRVGIEDDSGSYFPFNFSQIVLIPERDGKQIRIYSSPTTIIENVKILRYIGKVSTWQPVGKALQEVLNSERQRILLVEPVYEENGVGRDIGRVNVYSIEE